jgi:hypothetical protein
LYFQQEGWIAFEKHLKFCKHRLSTGLDTQLTLRTHGDLEIYKRQPNYTLGLQYLADSLLGYIDEEFFHNAGNDAAITLQLIIWTLRRDLLFERLQFLKKHLEPFFSLLPLMIRDINGS